MLREDAAIVRDNTCSEQRAKEEFDTRGERHSGRVQVDAVKAADGAETSENGSMWLWELPFTSTHPLPTIRIPGTRTPALQTLSSFAGVRLT